MSTPLVLVTGVSGFLGSYVVKHLLAEGFRVRGTVRGDPASPRFGALRALDERGHLELVEADLTTTDQDGWNSVARGVHFCMHTASPVLNRLPVNETEEILIPAVNGTEKVVRACLGAGAARVVVTSSESAVFGDKSSRVAYTEDGWTDPGSVPPYERSKTLAEQAAWRVVGEVDGAVARLVAINPGWMIGPLLDTRLPGCVELVQMAMQAHRLPLAPQLHFNFVDVRDVAAAHVAALTAPQAAGQRFLCGGRSMAWVEMNAILREEFGPLGYWITLWSMPRAVFWALSLFDEGVALLLADSGNQANYENRKSAAVLNLTFSPIRDVLVETVHSLIKHGLLYTTAQYTARAEL